MRLYASVKVSGGIEEESSRFEDTIDHDDLAEYIGKTVVRAINKVRERNVCVTEAYYVVRIRRDK